jgi:quercetin dioxygenase-like cupin family protein
MSAAIHTPAGTGPSVLMIGTDVITTLIAGDTTDDAIAIVEGTCLAGGGPHPHTDPWRESFYVLEGELAFQLERDGRLEGVTARAGDALSVPAGVGHAFTAAGDRPARFLVISTPGGIDRFFADAGESVTDATPRAEPGPIDRERLGAAFERHGIKGFEPAEPGAGSS